MQQETIKLQTDLVQSKDEQIQKISSVVHESVGVSLKEFKSYSQAVQSQSEAPQAIISSSALH